MAILIYGKLISYNDSSIIYEISKDSKTWRRITFSESTGEQGINIHCDNPQDQSSAVPIAVKCIREHRRTGEWPKQVTYAA